MWSPQLLGASKDYNQTEIYDAMASAWYCLQPTGDSPTRAQIYDCLAAGETVFGGVHCVAVPFVRYPAESTRHGRAVGPPGRLTDRVSVAVQTRFQSSLTST